MEGKKEYLLVAGCRDFEDAGTFARVMEANISSMKDLVIIEGGAMGTDAMAKKFAQYYRVEIVEITADWEKYGRAAGPKRNDAMTKYTAEHGGRALFFWDGKSKGTANCIKIARKKGIPLRVWSIPEGRYMEEAEEGTEK